MSCSIQNCSACEPVETCQTCASGYIFNADKSACLDKKLCSACSTVGKICNSTGLQQCDICPGKINFDNNICLDTTPCTSCESNQICEENNPGNALTCVSCSATEVPNAKKTACLSTSKCSKCTSFELCVEVPGSLSLKCVSCPDNMPTTTDKKQCLQSTFCTSCATKNAICDPSGAENCLPCTQSDISNGLTCEISPECQKIDSLCVSCTPTACTACAEGSTLVSGACASNGTCSDENCVQCETFVKTSCKTCKSGYKQRFGDCVIADCATDADCSALPGQCVYSFSGDKFVCECANGSLNQAGEKCLDGAICGGCKDTQQICAENAVGDAFVCIDCGAGTKFFNGKCVADNCQNCAQNQICSLLDFKIYECADCVGGKLANGEKTKCLDSKCIADCSIVNAEFACVQGGSSFSCGCKAGFKYAKGDDKCVKSSCDQCINVQGTVCVEIKGEFKCECSDQKYVFENGKCVPDCSVKNGVSAFCLEQGVCDVTGKCACEGNRDPAQNCGACQPGSVMGDKMCVSISCGTNLHCNGRGTCQNGVCNCNLSYQGANCENCSVGYVKDSNICVSPSCLTENKCSGNGSCVNQKCVCQNGNIGIDCQECLPGLIVGIKDGKTVCISLNKSLRTGDIISIVFGLILLAAIVIGVTFIIVSKKRKAQVAQDLSQGRFM